MREKWSLGEFVMQRIIHAVGIAGYGTVGQAYIKSKAGRPLSGPPRCVVFVAVCVIEVL
jgi:hypothetical protein